MLGQILVQASYIQLVSIVHRIKVLKIEVANINASVEYSVISIRRRLPRSLRTSENSRYAKFARDSDSFPRRPGKGPSHWPHCSTLLVSLVGLIRRGQLGPELFQRPARPVSKFTNVEESMQATHRPRQVPPMP